MVPQACEATLLFDLTLSGGHLLKRALHQRQARRRARTAQRAVAHPNNLALHDNTNLLQCPTELSWMGAGAVASVDKQNTVGNRDIAREHGPS